MVGTLQEVLDVKKEQKSFEEMSDFEMKQLPRGLRIDIPLKSTMEIRRVAALLHKFADMMERESKRQDLTPVQILRNVWGSCRTLRMHIEDICRSGYKHRREREEQNSQ
jgi:hypothetical protein